MSPHERFPLPILLGLLVSSIMILRMFLPEITAYFFAKFEQLKEAHEAQLRLVIALLFFVLIIYSSLDVHPVIGAFLVGFVLSDIPQSATIKDKLSTIGYAIFIPVFLFITGININPGALFELTLKNYLPLVIIGSALASKIISGYLGAKLSGFSSGDSFLIGLSSSTKLTVAVSTAFAAFSMGLINNELYSVILILSVITTFVNPLLMLFIINKSTTPEK
jgi:Kef-type K+ transport system membrane component KefB